EVAKHFGAFASNTLKTGLYATIFMVITAIIVSKGISNGIERLARVLMPTLIIMILCLVGYSFTLPNAFAGVKFYLIPDLSEINASVISGALRQAFFSLSLGMGALITFGSYLSREENIVSSSAIITLSDVGIAFIAGFMIFPLVAFNNGGDMSMVQSDQAGPGLIFVTLPGIFETLGPGLGRIVGSFFFLLLSFAALTSTVALLEVPVSYVIDEFNIKRPSAVILMATLIFIIGIPSLLSHGASHFFSTWFKMPGGSSDFTSLAILTADVILLFGGFFIVFFAAHIWRKENLHTEIAEGNRGYLGSKVHGFLHISIGYIAPALLAVLFFVVLLNNYFGISIV
ncbi:MAG: sodium-dependent transporter, partial [Thiotrichales bacterium]|nr:sodium-dependent transporter [Thiotrichales bacterium]